MTPLIVESGMTFGAYPEGYYFYIEKSRLYQEMQQNIPMVEFLWLKTAEPPVVWIVEAKSSSPQKNAENWAAFSTEIQTKFVNGLSLTVASCLKRHPMAARELPTLFQTLDLSKVQFKLVLVIRGHKPEWLPPLQDAIQRTCSALIKTWGIRHNVMVLNESLAVKHGLIKGENNA